MDDALVKLVLGDLPAADADRERRVRHLLETLHAASADVPAPPPGLATAAIARVAEVIVATRPASGEREKRKSGAQSTASPRHPVTPPPRRPVSRRRTGLPSRGWANVAVAAGIGFVAVGIGLGVLVRIRHDADRVACQDRMRAVYTGLAGHADRHDGRLPQVGSPGVPTAGSFVVELARSGDLPNFAVACPAADPDDLATIGVVTPDGRGDVATVGYTYNLGYRSRDGELVGVRRAENPDLGRRGDFTPIIADMPSRAASPGAGPVSPHPRGQNVLYLGGTVRFATSAAAGVNGDDIYRNDAGLVHAGLRPDDAALGRPADLP